MTLHKKTLLTTLMLILGLAACKESNKISALKTEEELLHESVQLFTRVITEDIFSPPVASRIYVYALLAAYEVSNLRGSRSKSFEGKLNNFINLPYDDIKKEYNINLAAHLALLYTGSELIFTKDSIDIRINQITELYSKMGLTEGEIQGSRLVAKSMSESVLQYASEDNYKQTRSYTKYIESQEISFWKPTPPSYIDGVEPHWSKIRPLILDSSSQFRPLPHTTFSTNSGSRFMSEALDVYQTVNDATEEQKFIADYWDCNPYKVKITGHIMHATKKITPGGHWINITGIACKQNQLNIHESLYAYSLIAIGIFDGFISCWDEKYRSNLLRPETYINQFIDSDWKPLLQTPPFPEYTSGHSVISTISADILTRLFGENFGFVDDSEIAFGLPVRKFSSFRQAAEEAAISRLYAGIHYLPAIENGKLQGHLIARYLLDKI